MELGEEGVEIFAERVPCQFCNRKFVPESLTKHAVVCEKTLRKKRKTFDSSQQRIKGTELAEFLPTVTTKNNEVSIAPPVKDKSAAVQRIVNTVHNVPASRKSIHKLASPLIKSSNYEKCPYCDRTFGPKAFDRHVEWCKEQSIRINSKSSGTQEAKERLEARIKYRAPSFKSKKSTTREKYSSKSHSRNSLNSVQLEDSRKENDVRTLKSLEAELKIRFPETCKPSKNTNFIRENVLRCSYKPKSIKKAESKTEKEHHNIQNKKKSDHSEIQGWISANGTKVKQYPQASKLVTANSSLTSSMQEDYDPFLFAEQQLKDLLSDGGNSSDEHLDQTYNINHQSTPIDPKEERRSKCQNKENIDNTGPVKSISCQTDKALKEGKSFKTSPTSAFEKYSAEKIVRPPTPAPDVNFDKNENFLPTITNNVKKGPISQVGHEGHNMNRYPLISLSNLSLCSSVSIDIPEENRKLGSCKSAEIRNDNEPPLMRRSVSASHDKPNKNFVKRNLKMENLLYGNDERDSNANDSYDQKLDKLNSMLEGENFDLMHSFSEFENVLQNSYYDNDRCTTGSESPPEKHIIAKRERGDSLASKASIDSAYNSLNRKSPSAFESQLYGGGKTSTPEGDLLKCSTMSLSSEFADFNSSNQQKLSKFCHECGARFPLAIAKFCCECGVRRLVI